MNTSGNKFDAIEQLIFEDGIKIEAVDIHLEQDLILLILNTKAVLRFPLSGFPRLKNAQESELADFIIIANGTGIHWPKIDEDLSLKGFLQQQLRHTVNNIAA